MRYPSMSAARRLRVLAEAATSTQDASPHYPPWYLRHRHFLPGGYLSRPSVAMYEAVVGRLYNGGARRWLERAIASDVLEGRPESVLELGCGTGRLLRAIRDFDPAVALRGVDLSPFMLERASARFRGVDLPPQFLHANAAEPVEGPPADAIVAVHVIGHMPAAAASRVLNTASRVLSAGGRLHVLDHTWHRLPNLPEGLELAGERILHGGLVRHTTFAHADAG